MKFIYNKIKNILNINIFSKFSFFYVEKYIEIRNKSQEFKLLFKKKLKSSLLFYFIFSFSYIVFSFLV